MKKLIILLILFITICSCQQQHKLNVKEVQTQVDELIYCYFFGNHVKDCIFKKPYLFLHAGHIDYGNNTASLTYPTNYYITCLYIKE